MSEQKQEQAGTLDILKDLKKPLTFFLVVLVAIVGFGVLGSGLSVEEMTQWFEDLGAWGPAIFVILYILAVVVAFPASILTVLAGLLFGAFWGVVLVSIASTTGASFAFLLARYVAREDTKKALAQKPAFKRLEMLTEDHGAMMVALVRLVPLFPFNLVNYGFGITKIEFKSYVFWSWLCMLPFTIVFVVGGDIAIRLSEGEVPWVLIVVVLMMLAILQMVVRHAKEMLGEKEQECLDARGATCVEDVIHGQKKSE